MAVISGKTESGGVSDCDALAKDGIKAKNLNLNTHHAFPLAFDGSDYPIPDEFEKVALSATYSEPAVAIVFSRTGKKAQDTAISAAYFRSDHLRNAVRFEQSGL
jgi:hypothetical protein